MAAVAHKHARRLSVFALVAALHIAVGWLLLEATGRVTIRVASSGLQLTYITPDVPKNVPTAPAPARPSRAPVRGSPVTSPLKQPRLLAQPDAAPPPAEENNAIHPPIDWANELTQAARDAAAGASAPQSRVFGAHAATTAPVKPPQFGWSHTRTHRMETGPGGTTIHLGDHCVITFTPLPSSVCTPGKKGANGDLFKHMRDLPQAGDSKDPP
ncbi:MAG: hypothetical protein M3N50_14365 [Pseudomonadota bacterium]|nr:hypothetical protein [Pseudomonadota bacterium]